MVGTGANRMPLTKIHPILLAKQSGNDGGGGGGGGGSLLAHHRQQHNERRQQMRGPAPGGSGPGGPGSGSGPGGPGSGPGQTGGGGPYGQQQQYGQYPPMQQHQQYNNNNQQWNQQQNTYQQQQQQQRPPMPPFNQMQQQQPPPPFGNRHPPPPQQNRQQNFPPMPPANQNNMKPGDGTPKKRKRPSRWGAKDDKTVVTGPVTLPANMTDEQRKNYLLQFKIEEITQKLRTGELGIPSDPGDRSPSPEPIYNSEGKRLNTREYRVRKRLEEERHTLIKQAVDEIPNYKPPADYKPPAQKISDKVFIPAERNPAVNFIGLLIGPRGNTLKRLEKETGCKIIIRGKGSVKEGKVGRVPGQLMPGEDEPLHALITGPTAEEVKKGVKVVGDIVKEGIECPDAANELRRNQLRELAELNGTLIDEEIIKCKNCGAPDHRHWECQEQKNITSQITCHKCGGYGHVAADCQVKTESNSAPLQTFAEKAKMDTEYMSLMAELGVDAPPPSKKPPLPNLPEPPKQEAAPKNPEPPSSSSSVQGQMGYNNRGNNFDQRDSGRKPSKWGPPSSGGGGDGAGNQNSGPKSLMDMNFGGKGNNQGNNFRGDRPPRGPPNQGAPWMNQNRPFGPRGGPPPGNNPPWQQNAPPRGPPNFNNIPPQQGPPPNQMGGQPPMQNYGQQPPWGQQAQTAYPNQQQWPQQQQYGGYNAFQQQEQEPYAPPPPWSQQPPPPPPPPPPTSS